MNAWLSPEGGESDLLNGAKEKAARLQASDAAFFALPVSDNREACEWALACFHSHVTFVPLPAALPGPALERRLAQLPGKVVFADSLQSASAVSFVLRPKSEIWAVIFTSGSTGEPKGVALTGAALEASAVAHARHCGTSSWLLDLPLHHIGGLSVLTRAFFNGTGLSLGEVRFSSATSAPWLQSGRVQGMSVVPTTLARLLDAGVDFKHLRIALLGGAPCSAELISRALQAGVPLRATYGMTEHTSQIATENAARSGLIALPGVELKIEQGEILVRSASLAAGYYLHGELTPLPLRSGFFPSGDLGELRDGSLLVTGRMSDVINSGGKKIHPAELEAEIARLSGVKDCAVTGVAHAEWGEVAAAAVVGDDFNELKAADELKTRLESWKIPKLWLRAPSIPRSAGGKVIRAELRELFKASRS